LEIPPKELLRVRYFLAVADGAIVLVCTFFGYEDVRQVLLHRMSRAEVLATPTTVPKGFDLDAHLEQGAWRSGAAARSRCAPW